VDEENVGKDVDRVDNAKLDCVIVIVVNEFVGRLGGGGSGTENKDENHVFFGVISGPLGDGVTGVVVVVVVVVVIVVVVVVVVVGDESPDGLDGELGIEVDFFNVSRPSAADTFRTCVGVSERAAINLLPKLDARSICFVGTMYVGTTVIVVNRVLRSLSLLIT